MNIILQKLSLKIPKKQYYIHPSFDINNHGFNGIKLTILKSGDMKIRIDIAGTNYSILFWTKEKSISDFIDILIKRFNDRGLKVLNQNAIETIKCTTKLDHILGLTTRLVYLGIPKNDYFATIDLRPCNGVKPFFTDDNLGSIIILKGSQIPLLKDSNLLSITKIKKLQNKINADLFHLSPSIPKTKKLSLHEFKIYSLNVVVPQDQYVSETINEGDYVFEISGFKFSDDGVHQYLSKLSHRMSQRKNNTVIFYDSSLYIKNIRFLYPIEKKLPYNPAEILHENNNLIIQYYTDQSIESALSFIFKEKVHYLEFDVEEKKVIMEDYISKSRVLKFP